LKIEVLGAYFFSGCRTRDNWNFVSDQWAEKFSNKTKRLRGQINVSCS